MNATLQLKESNAQINSIVEQEPNSLFLAQKVFIVLNQKQKSVVHWDTIAKKALQVQQVRIISYF